jgi:Single-stranded DNA-binding protein, Bacteriophage T7
MPTKRVTAPNFTSFKGTFKYPRLNEPDTKFKAEGEYSVKLIGRLDDPAVHAFVQKLMPLHEAAVKRAEGLIKKGKKLTVNPLFNTVFDETTEEDTGEIEFTFKMAASGEYKNGPKAGQKWSRKPGLFDAKGNAMVKAPSIWGGTVGKVSFEVGVDRESGEPGYFVPGTGACGLSLRLLAVQIIDLVSGGQRTAAAYGFGEEEGYSASDDTTEEGEATADAMADANADF